jgi:heme A synthase
MLGHVRKVTIVLRTGMMMFAFLIAFAIVAGEPIQGQTAEAVRNEDRAASRWMTLAGGLLVVGAGGCAVASIVEYRTHRRASAEEARWE